MESKTNRSNTQSKKSTHYTEDARGQLTTTSTTDNMTVEVKHPMVARPLILGNLEYVGTLCISILARLGIGGAEGGIVTFEIVS